MLDVERHRKQLVSQEHVDDGEIDKHFEIEIGVLAFARAFGDFLEICSIGTNTEIVIILSKIRTCFGFGNEVEAYALASKVRYLLKGRKPGLFCRDPVRSLMIKLSPEFSKEGYSIRI